MALTINTNTTSLLAHYKLNQNISGLSKSIERLSSGLRINRAADDASSLFIATGLDSQALSLGQAIRNANDGISVMQVVDSALAESVNILQSIKTKATQAAQDSQTATTRRTIQSDIDKLLSELDVIAKNTTFNGQRLLSGIFSDKKFQVGAYSGETLSVSLDSAERQKVGHVRSAQLSITNDTGGAVDLSFYSNLTGETLSLQSVNVQYDNTAANSMAEVADVINNFTDETGISGRAVVEFTGASPIQAGATAADFAINDITIGAVTTLANDSDSALITAINNKTSSHGVTASVTSDGALKLVSNDGRAIKVANTGTALDATDAANASTFGYVQLYQVGSYSIDMTDESAGQAVNFTSNLDFSGTMTTTIDSTLASGTVLGSGSSLAAGFTAGVTITGAMLNGNIATTTSSTLQSGTVLASGSIIEKGTVIGGTVHNDANLTTTANSLLKSGSILISGSVIEGGSYITNTIYSGGSTIAAGTTLSTDTTISGDVTLSNDMLLLNGSILQAGGTIAAGSYIGSDVTMSGSTTLSQDMTLLANSTIVDTDGTTSIAAGSTVGGAATLNADVTLTQSMTLKSGSVLASTSTLAAGSTLGGDVTVNGDHTTNADLSLAADSVLASGSVLKTGTVLTNDIDTTAGTIASGTTIEQDYTTSGTNTLTYAMTLESGSIVASSSTLTANSGGAASVTLDSESTMNLADLTVLTADDAQDAIAITDAAIDAISALRSSAGAMQNQFTSNVANLTATKYNITAAHSRIMDVDFAEETTTMAKFQVLTQMSAFALTQANAVAANVYDLLQGGSS